MTRVSTALALALLLSAGPALAQETAADKAVGEVLGRFFAELRKGDGGRAADAVSLEFRLDDAARKRFRGRLEALVKAAGAAESWHLVKLEGLPPLEPPAERLHTAWVVSFHASRPVAWAFSFYRLADGSWSLLTVGFDSDDPMAFLSRRASG